MKSKVLLTLLFVGALSFSLFAIPPGEGGFQCRTSANAALNEGHCREYSEGNEICFPDGEGPKCWKSEFTPE